METIFGIVRDKKVFKWGGFFYLDSFGIIHQCVVKNEAINFKELKSESYVKVTGEFVDAKVNKPMVCSDSEINVESIETLTEPYSFPDINIYAKDIVAEQKTILDNRPFTLRNQKNISIFRIQSKIQQSFRRFFENQGFISINTPKIVSGVAEGGANMFELDYFGKPAFLAQSPQLYKQMMCAVFGKVYETAPVFRAEKHSTSRHINEYTSLDIEMALKNGFHDLIEIEKKFFQFLYANLALDEDLKYLGEDLSSGIPENAITLMVEEVKDLLGTSKSDYDLSSEEEQAIGQYALEEHNTDLVFVTHYHKDKRPFYTMLSEDGIHTESFDLIYRGIEITSGGQRKHSYDDYVETMEKSGMNIENFDSYLQAFEYGMPLHGGFAIGLERLTAKICGIDSTKMCTLFPRDVERLKP